MASKFMNTKRGHSLFVYIAAFAIAVLIASTLSGVTNYYSNTYTYANLTSLPRTFSVETTSMFNGYSEVVQLQSNQSLAALMLHSAVLRMDSIHNSESTAALLYIGVFSIILFDYFSKELNPNRIYKYAGGGAIALFSSFFISIIVSQYVTACYYFCSGGAIGGVSGFQVDSAAAAAIFASFAIASIVGAFRLRSRNFSLLVAALIVCGVIIVVSLSFLSADLGFRQAGSLPEGSYAVHGFDLVTFYSFFIITYLVFNFLAMRRQE